LCLHRLGSGPTDEPDPSEVVEEDPSDLPLGGESTSASPRRESPSPGSGPSSPLGREIARLHAWADETDTGDRDDLPRGVSDAAWRQVSVTSRECLGQLCPVVSECFAELARQDAARADAVVIDEAHELSDRVTGVTTGELTGAAVIQAARRAAKLTDQQTADRMVAAGEDLASLLEACPEGRWDLLPDGADAALASVRQTAENCRSAVPGP